MQNKKKAPRQLRQRRLLAPAAAARPLGARAARSRAAARARSPRPPPPSHGALHPPGSESPHDHPPPPRPGLRCTRHPRLRRWQRQRVMACWAYAGDNDGRHTYYAARVITGFCCRSVPWPGPAAGRAHARHDGEYRYHRHLRHLLAGSGLSFNGMSPANSRINSREHPLPPCEDSCCPAPAPWHAWS